MITPKDRKNLSYLLDLINKNRPDTINYYSYPMDLYKKSVYAYIDLCKEVENQLENIEDTMADRIKEFSFRAKEDHLFSTIEEWGQVFWHILCRGAFFKYDSQFSKEIYIFGKPTANEVIESIIKHSDDQIRLVVISTKGIDDYRFPFVEHSKRTPEFEEKLEEFDKFAKCIYYNSPPLLFSERERLTKRN